MSLRSVSSDSQSDSPVQLQHVTLSETSMMGIAFVRILTGFLWFEQLFWKLPPTFGALHHYVAEEARYAIVPGYGTFVQQVLLTHFGILGICTLILESLVALSLLFGIVSRLGGALAAILSIQLYLGLAYAPGEWFWTYGMLILLGIVLASIPSGRRLGIDMVLQPALDAVEHPSFLQRLVKHFV